MQIVGLMLPFVQNQGLPPYEYLIQVLQNNPKSALTYIHLWNAKDKECRIILQKKDVRPQFLITPDKFLKDIEAIACLCLLNFFTSPKFFEIELVDYQYSSQDGDEFIPC